MLKYVTPSWGNPTPYSKTLDISGPLANREPERAKESFIPVGIIYSVGLYQRGVVIRGGRERELK